MSGVVWKTSPYDDQSTSFALMGEGFGQSPFIVREVGGNGQESIAVPYLIAAGTQSVKGLNLLSGEVIDIVEFADAERIFASFAERFVTVEINGQDIYFLKESQGVTTLRVQPMFAGEGKDIPLEDPVVAGPIKIGERICLYAKNTLYVLENGHIRPHQISGGFNAWVAPTDADGLHPHFGRMPVLVRGESAYIPGSRGSSPGFLFVAFQNNSLNFAFLPCNGDVSYTQDLEGRLLLARSGEITVYEHTTPRVVRRDGQLSPRGIPYYSNPLTVGSTMTPGGAHSLRFYGDAGVRDYSLATVRGFVEIVGFSSIAGAFVFMHLDDNSHLGITVWDT